MSTLPALVRRLGAFVLFTIEALAVTGAGCAPRPRNVACSNDGECTRDDPSYRYCIESRCVECVGDSGCSPNGKCLHGACVIACKDGRDCPGRQTCHGGTCRTN